MNGVIYKSKIITLRYTEEKDLKFVINAERASDNAKFVGQWSETQHLNSLKDEDVMHIIVESSDTNQLIGYVILAGLQNINHNIEFRRFVICHKGKGFGRKTLKQIKQIAFEKLNAHRLWLDVRINNSNAQKLYKSESFIEEGILRECILNGDMYESLIVMSILKNEYEAEDKNAEKHKQQ
ncbi:N-acetyltransferase [Clostridium zeae]|uniref:N-acetyltransferase n=1 Tax=Clostridium zeae TaxID=2759022 RepID=A0ABQ1E502_9CLOT|nr:GNAT family protein [Clostridium zeae]GFZ29809.1 N-acetyltransferase [Clostridium zeae]